MSDLKDINIEYGKISLGDLLKELGIDLDHMNKDNDNDNDEFPKRGEEYWSIEGGLPEKYVNRNPFVTGHAKMAGTLFKTEVEAKCFLGYRYLMTRQDLINDTHGFKYDGKGEAYCVVYDYQEKKLKVYTADRSAVAEIMFKTGEDAEKSIKEHGEEWKAYLGVID